MKRTISALVCSTLIFGAFIEESYAWKRDPCHDSRAICKNRGGQKVCGYPGESFSNCGSLDIRPKNRIEAPKRDRISISSAIERKREKCRRKVMKERAREGSGELSTYMDALKLNACNNINR